MIENISQNKEFEQKLSSEAFQKIIERNLKNLREYNERIEKQTRSYPISHEQYVALDLNDRLSAAVEIFIDQAHRKPFIFDISSLSTASTDSLQAHITYDQGKWTNALNSTHIDRLPHLAIDIVSNIEGSVLKSHFADLDIISRYNEEGYKNYMFTHRDFRVVGDSFNGEVVADPNHPLFCDTVAIVDTGISALYREKITSRIAMLGIATAE